MLSRIKSSFKTSKKLVIERPDYPSNIVWKNLDKTYKAKIKKGICCACMSFLLGLTFLFFLTLIMYVNAAVRLNIGTRETLHNCSQISVKIEEISSFHAEEEMYTKFDGEIYCFCKNLGFFNVMNGSHRLKKYCQFLKTSNLIKSITTYLVPILIILSNNFYRTLIQTLVRIFPFKESSKEVFVKTFLFHFLFDILRAKTFCS